MEELTIDDKKYISSKRAAQITGYAKDYIGQLCREGYVEARRVGRSWYVLEAAIKDHRFGTEPHKDAARAPSKASPAFTLVQEEAVPSVSSATELAPMPRYEALEPPSINLLRKDVPVETPAPMAQGGHEASQEDFHQAWQTWFDTFHAPQAESVPLSPVEPSPQEAATVEAPVVLPALEAKEEVSIPIHRIEQPNSLEKPLLSVPKPLPAPMMVKSTLHHRSFPAPAPIGRHAEPLRATRVLFGSLCLIICAISTGIAALSTGYFDDSIVSVTRANLIDGMFVINK